MHVSSRLRTPPPCLPDAARPVSRLHQRAELVEALDRSVARVLRQRPRCDPFPKRDDNRYEPASRNRSHRHGLVGQENAQRSGGGAGRTSAWCAPSSRISRRSRALCAEKGVAADGRLRGCARRSGGRSRRAGDAARAAWRTDRGRRRGREARVLREAAGLDQGRRREGRSPVPRRRPRSRHGARAAVGAADRRRCWPRPTPENSGAFTRSRPTSVMTSSWRSIGTTGA